MYENRKKTEEYIQNKTKEELTDLLYKYGPRDRRLMAYKHLGFYLDVGFVEDTVFEMVLEEIVLGNGYGQV